MVDEQSSTELAVLRERGVGVHTGQPAYKEFSQEMIALVGKAIMPKQYELHELYYVLELAATYDLDPFTRELQAVRFSKNAESGGVQVVVGIAGLVAIAERHPDYLGFRNAAVYENDEFEQLAEPVEWKLPSGESVYTRFKHRVVHFKREDRGKLLGAFAEVYRRGRAPSDFIAYLEDYDKGSSSDRSPWLKMKDVMIEKVSLVTALRRAFRIGGLYIAEEFAGQRAIVGTDGQLESQPADQPEWGDDPVVAQRLRDLFDHLGNRYLPAKRLMLLKGLDGQGRAELVATLEREILDEGGTPPPPPDPEDVEPAEPVDAEIVDEADEIEFGEPGQAKLPVD